MTESTKKGTPLLSFGHDSKAEPIGTMKNVRMEGGSIKGTVELTPKGMLLLVEAQATPVISERGWYVWASGVYRAEVSRSTSRRWRFRVWNVIGPLPIVAGVQPSLRKAKLAALEGLFVISRLAARVDAKMRPEGEVGVS
jgi:hypothetical protein